ncbi:MAG TPA: flavodoxin domain-containing protein [Anaerolineales bacterium]|nr:flavodoxin domain-containing protein [Anaerolineales bacterium]
MARALVIYDTLKGATKSIGELIAKGLMDVGVSVDVKNAVEITQEKDLVGYDAYIFGSATYHGEMMNSMKRLLFLAEKARLRGRVGGAFGAYGWSGEAPRRIFDTMCYILGMSMVKEPLRLKSPKDSEALERVSEYGCLIAEKLKT